MDIVAKHVKPTKFGVRIACLDEQMYKEKLWNHKPLTDFCRVGKGIATKLEKNHMYTMGDIARCSINNEEKLFNELFYSSDEINVADIYITCCAVLLVLFVVFYYKDEELESIFQRKDSKQ